MQDLLRFSSVASKHPGYALLSDCIWLAFSGAALAWRLVGHPESWQVVALWVVGACVALAALVALLKVRVMMRGLRVWLMESWVQRTHLSLGALASSASVAFSAVLVGRIAGLGVVGTLAGAGQLLAPVNVLVAYLSIAVVPHAVHLAPSARSSLFRSYAWKIGTVGVVSGLVLFFLPDTVGELLLGSTWASAKPIMPIMGLQYALVAVYMAALGLMTTLGGASKIMVLNVSIGAVRVLLAGLTAAAIATAAAQAWAGCFVALGSSVACWWLASNGVHAGLSTSETHGRAEPLDL
jgi:O-antigen/teichoic acid export membrane protein